MSLRFWLSRYSSTFVITLEALFTMNTSAPRLKIFSATYPLIPFTKVTTAISADTAITTPSSVKSDRSLLAHKDCRAMRIASELFIQLSFGYVHLSLAEPRWSLFRSHFALSLYEVGPFPDAKHL